MEKHERDGTTELANAATATNKPTKYNPYCMANVLTGSVITSKLQNEKEKSLSKVEMQEKLSQDRLL